MLNSLEEKYSGTHQNDHPNGDVKRYGLNCQLAYQKKKKRKMVQFYSDKPDFFRDSTVQMFLHYHFSVELISSH